MSNKVTVEDFIQRARQVHGDKYDYSRLNYVNIITKACIVCPEHGEFWQYPYVHLKGSGCPECGKKMAALKHNLTIDEFIERAKKKHGDKYDYSKVEYMDIQTPVCIICPEHGEFWQRPSNHIEKSGCPECGRRNIGSTQRNSLNDFIEKAKKKHGDKYDYSKVEYTNGTNKVCIICPEHGEFWQIAKNHLSGGGCPKCQGYYRTTDEFIKESNLIHNNKYDYSKVDYVDSKTPVCIICPEHGEFWQVPGEHCPKCLMSSLEKDIEQFLIDNNIKYEWQKTFSWLKYKKPLKLDFYLPEYNVAIECQGEQHSNNFKRKWYKITEEQWKEIDLRDKLKKELCLENNIKILYYSNKNIEFFDKVYTDKNELLNEIKKS